MNIKNIKGDYLYQKYKIDSSCSNNCTFAPAEEKELNLSDYYQETLSLSPYSVNMIILNKKPAGPETTVSVTPEQPAAQNIEKVNAPTEAKEKIP